jgi:iron complex transport system ATP-binding protein
MTSGPMPLIELHNLSAGYGSHILFRGLNLKIDAGQLICFMGPNGVGKSTLIRTIGGLLKPMTGTIVLHGSSILREQLIALVLTDPIQASYLTVEDLVVFGRYPYLNWQLAMNDRDRSLVDEAIDKVNINHLRNSPITELSDGQKQMAMIARALAQDTPVVILDEPTAHLDLNNRVEIMRLLKDLTRTMNKAIVMATHELDLALQTADLIWLAGHETSIITGIPEDLVLQGMFDEVFRFKGFDLKTGKMTHPVFRDLQIQLHGTGHAYLWTRNLLERNGFAITSTGEMRIDIETSKNQMSWVVDKGLVFDNLGDLLQHLRLLK